MMMNKYYGLNLFRKIMHIMCKLKLSKHICRHLNIARHKYILRKLTPYFIYAEKRARNINKHSTNNHIIWMFWWQGVNNMPSIVKACINSIKNNYNPQKVILIDKNNIDNYIKFPRYILQRIRNKRITLTHFSDLIRFKLLRKYGGLWIDSTVFCTSRINYNKFSELYTSGGYANDYKYYISSKWTGFLIGGSSNNPLFTFMDEFFKIYWKNQHNMIDYFLIDYGLYYAYLRNIGGFKDYVDDKAYKNNPHLPCLMNLLNKKYNFRILKDITNDTNLFKLTYKKHFYKNRNTFYHKMIL